MNSFACSVEDSPSVVTSTVGWRAGFLDGKLLVRLSYSRYTIGE